MRVTTVYRFTLNSLHTRTQYRCMKAMSARVDAWLYGHKLGLAMHWQSLDQHPRLNVAWERLRQGPETATFEYGARDGWSIRYYGHT